MGVSSPHRATDHRAARSSVPPEDRLLSLLVALRTAPHPMSGKEISLHVNGYPGVWDDSAKRLLERDKQLARQLGLPLETVHEGPGARYRLRTLAAATAVESQPNARPDAQSGANSGALANAELGRLAGPGLGSVVGQHQPTGAADDRMADRGHAQPQAVEPTSCQWLDGLVRPVRLSPAQLGVLTLAAEGWSEGELAATARSALAKLRGMGGPALEDGEVTSSASQRPQDRDADQTPEAAQAGESVHPALADQTGRAGQPGPSDSPARTNEAAHTDRLGIVLRLPAGEVRSALLEAVATRRRVTFDYESAPLGATRARLVEPYRLRLGEPGWYLEGRDVELNQPRTYRLSRIRSAVRLVSAPAFFTPDAAPTVRLTAHLAIAPGHGLALRRRARADAAPAPDQAAGAPPGWDRVAVTYGPVEAAGLAGEIAAQCQWVRVLAPTELVGLVREHLDGVCAVVERHSRSVQDRSAHNTSAQTGGEPVAVPVRDRRAGGTGGQTHRIETRAVREARSRPTAREAISRRLALLAWVERHPGASLAEAAAWFDVSEETIYQDVMVWWSAGRTDAPDPDMLDFDQGALEAGELYLTRGLQMSEPVGLTAQEVTCLRVALEVLRHGLGEDDRLARLIEQADRALGGSGGDNDDPVADTGGRSEGHDGERADLDAPGAQPVLTTIRAAMDVGESVHLVYVDALDQRTERDVDPLELILGDPSHTWGGSGAVPILRAWCHLAAAQRSFRLDRVLEAVLTGNQARPPARAHRRQRPQRPSFRARVHVSAAGTWLTEEPYVQAAERLEDGTWEVDVASWNRQWLVHLILRAGRVLQDVSPQALAQEAADLARQALSEPWSMAAQVTRSGQPQD